MLVKLNWFPEAVCVMEDTVKTPRPGLEINRQAAQHAPIAHIFHAGNNGGRPAMLLRVPGALQLAQQSPPVPAILQAPHLRPMQQATHLDVPTVSTADREL